MQEEFSKKMFRFGAERFVAELEQLEIPDNSYLVFDQADDLISLHDVSLAIEQVDILSKWLAAHQITALLTFLRVTESHAGTINALMDYLTGIVRLGGDESGLRLGFDYWQSPDGTVAAKNFQLLTLSNNCYEATTKQSGNEALATETSAIEQDVPPQEPLSSYFYMDPDLGSLATQMAGNWQRVDTLVGMMHSTRNKRRAIAIFCYKSDTNLRQLAEAIHTPHHRADHRAGKKRLPALPKRSVAVAPGRQPCCAPRCATGPNAPHAGLRRGTNFQPWC
jgi:hypothetical protein